MFNRIQKKNIPKKITGMGMISVMTLIIFLQAFSFRSTASPRDNGNHASITATATGGVLTCTSPVVTLDVITDAIDPAYSWTGPNGYTASAKNPVTTVPGNYTVVVTGSGGQSASATALVTQNIAAPGAFASVSGTLTCIQTSVILSGSSSVPGAGYRWTGPGGFSSTVQNAAVTQPGIYFLTVTNPVNGCTSTAAVTVQQNVAAPGATANASGVLTCATPTVTLIGSSFTSGVLYSWTGPGGFTSTQQNVVTSMPGAYSLVVTNLVNGCSSSATVFVQQNFAIPNVMASVSGVITCDVPFATLIGSSSTAGVTFLWTGPFGFETTEQEAITTFSGSFTLTVTHPLSGCTASAEVEVTAENCDELSAAGVADAIVREDTPAVLLYPNPVKSNGTIQFTARERGNVKLEIYTLLNVKVATLFEGTVLAGSTYSVNFDAANFAEELHVYRITGAGISEQGRFFVSR